MNNRFFWLPILTATLILCSLGVWLDSQIHDWLKSGVWEDLKKEHVLVKNLVEEHHQDTSAMTTILVPLANARPGTHFIVMDEKGKELNSPGQSRVPAILKQTNEQYLANLQEKKAHEREISKQSTLFFARDEFLTFRGKQYMLRIVTNGESIQKAFGASRLTISLAVALFLIIGFILGRIGSLQTYQSLRRMLQQVRPIAKALAARPDAQTKSDEMATIAKSVRKLANNMEQTLSDLAEERNRFSTVLEGMDTGVMSLNRDHRITMANPSAQRLLSTKDSMVDLPLVDVWRTPAIHELVEEAWESGASIREIELISPVRRVLRVHGTANESAQTLVLVMDEITQLKALETIRKDFVANVSHELRTPVSVIQANAETLMGGAMNDERNGPLFLEAILRNAKRLAQLITDLLDLAQLESGNYSVEQKIFSVKQPLESVLDSLSNKARSKGMHIVEMWDLEHRVWGDERAVSQVITNFLDNAIKYTPESGTVVVRTKETPISIQIEVEDNGPGIEPRHHSRLFERFYRVDTGRSRELGGTGLGLAIVKHLSLSMGGRVGIRSAEPQGSIFWLELPKGTLEYGELIEDEGEED